jgi:two-component system chemotaxis response regulator CheY
MSFFKSKKENLLRTLVVDDTEYYRESAKNVLQSLGCDVTTAVDGQKAWLVIQAAEQNKTPFDLIVSDWQMPEMDGVGLLKTVRTSAFKGVTFIMLTTSPRAEEVQVAAELYHPDAVLGKPAEQHMSVFKAHIEALRS